MYIFGKMLFALFDLFKPKPSQISDHTSVIALI